jgi:hypothetical protein
MAVMSQHLQKTAPRVNKIRTDLSVELAATVARCLARNPDDRFPDMKSLIEALDHPETVDTTILTNLDMNPHQSTFWQSQTIRGVGIALAILIAFAALAFLLQVLHH